MKNLLLITLLTLCGNLYAQFPDMSLADENVEIETLETTLRVKIKVQQYNAMFAGVPFERVHLPGTFASKSSVIELTLDKSDCYIPENLELINCISDEATIIVSNGEGKILLDKEFKRVRFEMQNRVLTWVGGDGHGNPDVRTEESKVVRLRGSALDGEGRLEVEFSNLIRWIK